MGRWMQAAGLAVVLAIGESCGLKSVPVPRLEVSGTRQEAPGPPGAAPVPAHQASLPAAAVRPSRDR